jgi:hypothetical protein
VGSPADPFLNPKTKIILTVALGLAWAASAVVGARALLKYESQPGKVGLIASAWPANSTIALAKGMPTLVMFAHPQCPCTRASVDELSQIMARSQGKVRTYVLFYAPRESGADWENSETRRTAAQIPGVTVLSDVDGAEAERFGAETSGHAFLFTASGHLLFNGGITASRGHSGDNAGEDAIVSLINGRANSRAQTFVFGCSFRTQPRGDQKCSR